MSPDEVEFDLMGFGVSDITISRVRVTLVAIGWARVVVGSVRGWSDEASLETGRDILETGIA